MSKESTLVNKILGELDAKFRNRFGDSLENFSKTDISPEHTAVLREFVAKFAQSSHELRLLKIEIETIKADAVIDEEISTVGELAELVKPTQQSKPEYSFVSQLASHMQAQGASEAQVEAFKAIIQNWEKSIHTEVIRLQMRRSRR